MNRAARRLHLFDQSSDYELFVEVLSEATLRFSMRLLCYVVMPNHWHLVLWPIGDEDLAAFMAWMTATHVRRWHLGRGSVGSGTLYQGRYKAVAVHDDPHLLTVCRYVERNPVRAGLVERPRQWKWSSAWPAQPPTPTLSPWPGGRPSNWAALIELELPPAELRELRRAIRHSRPFGPDGWRTRTAVQLNWPGRHPRGRPARTDRKN